MRNKLFIFLYISFNLEAVRSSLRPIDEFVPVITTQLSTGGPTYSLRDSHLQKSPLFEVFNLNFFEKNIFPDSSISLRYNSTQSIQGSDFKKILDQLVQDIRKGKKKFSKFIALKKRDFNFKQQAGLIVLKCTDPKYPFIVKLFMETPRSFIRPYHKGFEPSCFFIIGGGATRHFVGFTRVKNMQIIRDRIIHNPYWASRVDLPRKWFWTPSSEPWMKLAGKNIGGEKQISIEVPAVYAIVEDAIDIEKTFSLSHSDDREISIDLCNFLLCRIDPHISNFVYEKGTGKIVIIDTEHFPTLVGFKKRPRITTYVSWYLHLVTKYLEEGLFATKKTRRDWQRYPEAPFCSA